MAKPKQVGEAHPSVGFSKPDPEPTPAPEYKPVSYRAQEGEIPGYHPCWATLTVTPGGEFKL